jgi:hypothetical protein
MMETKVKKQKNTVFTTGPQEIDVTDVLDGCEYDNGSTCRVPGHIAGDTNECIACGTVRTALEINSLARQLHLDITHRK